MRRPHSYNLPKLDAAENVFFSRQLELIDPLVRARKYAERKARMFVPTGPYVPDGIELATFRETDKVAKPKRIANATDDLPLANVFGTESSARLADYGMAYAYTKAEIKAGALTGQNLDQQRAEAAREALAQLLDTLVATGDSDLGTKGILNLASTNDVTGTLTGAWHTATAAQIIADFKKIVNASPDASKDIEKTKRVIFPTKLLRIIESMPRSDNSDTTVLQFLKTNYPSIELMDWERANGAGAAAKDRIVAYDPDIACLRHLMSVELDVEAPQLRNFSYLVNMRMRAGGVVLFRPKSVTYGDVASS